MRNNTWARVLVLLLTIVLSASVANAKIQLYGTEIDNDSLFFVDLSTGAGTSVGSLSPAQIEGLAFDPVAGTFYGTDNSNHTLIEIATTPFSAAIAQALPYGTYANLARHPQTGLLYTLDYSAELLRTIDPDSGDVSTIGSTDLYVESLAFDSSGRLFGIGNIPAPAEEALYEIDLVTGAIISSVEITSDLVNPRFDNSLAIHPITGKFYSVAAIEGSLYEINPSTGVATRIGSTGRRNVRSLEFAMVVPEPTALSEVACVAIGLALSFRSRLLAAFH